MQPPPDEAPVKEAVSLENHPFFSGISRETLARMVSEAETITLPPGELIFEEGAPSDLLYLVLDGTVEFLKHVEGNTFHAVSTTTAGEFFGEIGLVTGEPRALRAQARTEVSLATLNHAQLEEVMSGANGPVALIQSLIRHLHHTTRQFTEEVLHREKMAVVGSMVNSILHDFKNPMACIRFATESLVRRHGENDRTADICRRIDDQIERMLSMATEVSLYSRGDYRPTVAPVRLPALMERFQELNIPFFENENLSISIEAEDIEFQCEESKLLRVLQNLVGNAIDAQSGEGEIRITGHRDGTRVKLTVSDSGDGIPEEIQDRFFEPFVTHGKRGGTGLGSAIAKSIVDAHGGSIRFETAPGQGTTFHILLPAATG